MRLLKSFFLSLALLLNVSAHAEPAVSVMTPPAVDKDATLRLLTSGGPGVYNHMQLDKTQIQAKFFDQIFHQRKVDYDYFLNTVNSIEKLYRELLKELVYDKESGLYSLSNRSTKSADLKPTDAETFMIYIGRYKQARAEIDAKIETLTAIADGIVPSSEDLPVDEAGIKKVPSFGQQNFTPIKKFYADQLAVLDTFVSNLPHKIELPGGAYHIIAAGSGKGLVLEAQIMTLTPEEIRAKLKKVAEMRYWDEDQTTTIDEYTRYLQKRLYAFTKTYGVDQRYRHQDLTERKARADEARLIMIGFWSRSYLRAIYGQPIGVIGIPYDDKWFHIDVLTTSTRALMQMIEKPIWDANRMGDIEKNYRRLIARADVRSEKILDGNLSFLAAGENLLTWLGGYRNEAQCAQMILRLLAADVYEERLLQEEGSLQRMAERFRARYFSTEEDEIFYRRAQLAYDKGYTGETVREFYTDAGRPEMIEKILGKDYEAFGGQAGNGSGLDLRSKYGEVLVEMKVKEEQLGNAELIEASIENARNPNNKFAKATNLRKKRL